MYEILFRILLAQYEVRLRINAHTKESPMLVEVANSCHVVDTSRNLSRNSPRPMWQSARNARVAPRRVDQWCYSLRS